MDKNKKKKQIVVLGAGFAGTRAVLDLAKLHPKDRLIIISHNSYHLFHPALYELATTEPSEEGALELKKTVAIPITDIIGKHKNITYKQAWVTGIDLDRRIVQTDDGDLVYDGLVVALGSQCDFYDIPGLADNALTLHSFEDAIKIRNKIRQRLRDAAGQEITIAVCGGGPTGVELAGELANHFGSNSEKAIVNLIEGGPQLLSGMPAAAGATAFQRLRSLGVKIRTGTAITRVLPERVLLGGPESIAAQVIVWAGGVKAKDVPLNKIISRDKKDRIVISSRLNLEQKPEVFVVGDSCCYMDPRTGRSLPPTASMALHQAKYAARALYNVLKGKPVQVYRAPKHVSFAIPLGGKYAMLVTRGKVISGFWGYIARRIIDLHHFISILPLVKAVPLWLKGSVIYIKND